MENEKIVSEKTPLFKKGKFSVNFPKVISEFENAMQKFPVKRILYQAAFRGKGLEFDSYRRFAPNDDAELIDWKASLRANDLLAKKYVEERNLNVYFLVDVSNSMLFGSGKKLKAEYAAELVIALSHLVINSGDRIGLVMFNDDVVKVLYPSNTKNQFALFTKFLSEPEFYGGGFELGTAIEHVLKTVKSSYTIFILVSDFIRTKKNTIQALKMLGNRFETMAIMVRDPFDESLPKTKYQFAIQDPYSKRQMVLDPEIAAERYHHEVLRHKAILKEVLRSARIDLLELTTESDFSIQVSSFLKSRAVGGERL